MAEIIGATAASIEIAKTIFQLKEKFQTIKSASNEVRALVDETARLNNLLLFLSRQQTRISPNVQPIPELVDIHDLCHTAANDLLQCVKGLDVEVQRAKLLGPFKIMIKEKAIEAFRQRLESAKLSLVIAQNAFSNILYHEQMLQTMDTKTLIRAAMAGTPNSHIALPAQPQAKQTKVQSGSTPTHFEHLFADRKPKPYRKPRKDYRFSTPTSWLGWTLQVRGWKYFDIWTFNFRIWYQRPDDSLIFYFAYIGHIDGIRHLLSARKASVADLNTQGSSALHIACRFGHIDIARLLIENGADVNQVDRHEFTCLTRLGHGLNGLYESNTAATSVWNVLDNLNKSGGLRALLSLLDETGCDDFINNTEKLSYEFSGGHYLDVEKELQDASRLVTAYMWPPYREFSLRQRLLNCAVSWTMNPKLFLEKLAQPIDEESLNARMWRELKRTGTRIPVSSMWHPIAYGLGNITRLRAETREKVRESRSTTVIDYLEGWRGLLHQVIHHGGADYFGTESVLFVYLFAYVGNADFEDTGGESLMEYAKIWTQELQQAGMSMSDLRKYREHEMNTLSGKSRHVSYWGLPNTIDLWSCWFEVTDMNIGPEASSWRINGMWTIVLKSDEASIKQKSENTPGAWEESADMEEHDYNWNSDQDYDYERSELGLERDNGGMDNDNEALAAGKKIVNDGETSMDEREGADNDNALKNGYFHWCHCRIYASLHIHGRDLGRLKRRIIRMYKELGHTGLS